MTKEARILSAVRNLMIVNRIDKAKQQLKKMQDVAPEDDRVLVVSGDMAMLENEDSMALAFYQRATKNAPDNKLAWLGLANMYYKLQRTEQADEALSVFETLDKAE